MTVLAHAGQPLAPHDLWAAWNLHPAPLLGLVLAGWAYRRGRVARARAHADAWRPRCFAGALITLGVALVSPLDALAGSLASAHMVQHVLLVLVAAPLLALSEPSRTLWRGSPPAVRQVLARWRRRIRLTGEGLRAVRRPTSAWVLHAAALWFWHAAVPYDAALGNDLLHVLEHVSFIVTAVLFWHAVVAPSGDGAANGFGILLLFAMAIQSTFLSALLTFASTPWYQHYRSTTTPWGLDPLADQQLAGLIMWVPAGVVYVGAALVLLVTWIRSTEAEEAEDAEEALR